MPPVTYFLQLVPTSYFSLPPCNVILLWICQGINSLIRSDSQDPNFSQKPMSWKASPQYMSLWGTLHILIRMSFMESNTGPSPLCDFLSYHVVFSPIHFPTMISSAMMGFSQQDPHQSWEDSYKSTMFLDLQNSKLNKLFFIKYQPQIFHYQNGKQTSGAKRY
jgi:hypothetical protein